MKDEVRIGGIYQIKNLTTKKVYIGSARYIKSRWSAHRCDLKLNQHDNSYLQNAWNKYGELDFEFSVLEQVSDFTNLESREQYWIDLVGSTDRELGYNIRIEANNNKGLSTRKGYFHSLETREKLSEALKGRVFSKEHLENLSKWQKGNIPIAATTQAAIVNRKEWKWPCPDGVKCKCSDCRRKWNDYLREWRKRKKENTFVEGRQR